MTGAIAPTFLERYTLNDVFAHIARCINIDSRQRHALDHRNGGAAL